MSPFAATLVLCVFVTFSAAATTTATTTTQVATTTSLHSIPLANKAVEPSCFTTVYPVSSTCYAVVHTLASSTGGPNKRDTVKTISRLPANFKAIAPSCSTVYSTTTSCYAGVHPQPTLPEATVTMTTTEAGSEETSTITTQAGLSVDVASPTAGGSQDYSFVISPELRTDIIDLANSFCPAMKIKRDPALGPSCRLPSNAQADFLNQFRALVADQAIIDAGNAAGTAGLMVVGVFIFSQLVNGLALPLSYNVPSRVAEELSSISTSSSSSSSTPPPTLIPGPPNQSPLGPGEGDIAALTEYLQDYFQSSLQGPTVTVTANSSFACTHGAAPNIFSGTAGYCVCGDGKTYPVSPVPRTTTIDGTKTTYNEDCPYTAIPSTTTDLGPTITQKPKPPSPTSTLGSANCYPGGASFKHADMKSAVKNFCRTASQRKWSTTYQAGAPVSSTYPANGFGNGQSQRQYEVDSEPAGSNLYLEVKFTTDACQVGEQMEADFRRYKWCKKSFMSVIDQCEAGDSKWQGGGIMMASCVQWNIQPA